MMSLLIFIAFGFLSLSVGFVLGLVEGEKAERARLLALIDKKIEDRRILNRAERYNK